MQFVMKKLHGFQKTLTVYERNEGEMKKMI